MISKNQVKLIRQLEQKKYRQREGLFVAEGPKVVGDLMRRWQPATVFATDDRSRCWRCFRCPTFNVQRSTFNVPSYSPSTVCKTPAIWGR